MTALTHITQVTIRLVRLGMSAPFRSSVGTRDFKEAVVIEVHTSDGIIGYGELGCRSDPYYSYEYNSVAIETLRRFYIPQMFGPRISSVFESLESTPVRGWPFTRHGLQAAVLDAIERADQSQKRPDLTVFLGHTSGIAKDDQDLRDRLDQRLRQGYRRVRFKANGGAPGASLIRAIERLDPGEFSVAVDFNGCLNPNDVDDILTLKRLAIALEPHSGYIEQPFPPGKLAPTATFRQNNNVKISLDEDISNLADLEAAHNLQALDICNIKPGRVGGLKSVREIASYCTGNSIKVQLGGMMETGVGRWANARIAGHLAPMSCHDMTLPQDYLIADLIAERIDLDPARRYASIPDRPVAIDKAVLDAHTVEAITVRP